MEEEAEFFGFAPASFISELQMEIENVLADGISRLCELKRGKMQRMSDVLLESFRRNYFIFSNFVLRNIVCFPDGFEMERRASEEVVVADMQQITDELMASFLEEERQQEEFDGLREDLEVEEYRKEMFCKMMRCSEPVKELVQSIRATKDELEAIKQLQSRLGVFGAGDDGFSRLLEYREIRSNFARKERDDLLMIGNAEVFAMMNESINKCDI
ncbi:hypothetical protein HK407_08g13020 [Ordospora pajunii]|uniref:uncharacterized protein n=1 Tax=Ordospora pajunii TaxID=3039483 RepID=UPI0029527316|nr:uncharacterized protein HK407_08g13020 [Ordospora pajunii]KAH9411157.1 hypothetical protein HK407_08g13020 [Ordospora pajunii]